MVSDTPIRSFAKANRELIKAYERYLISRGNAAPTRRAYLDAVNRLAESIGSQSVIDLERSSIRELLVQWVNKGLTDNSIRLHTSALRNFFKFVRLSGLTQHDPMLMIAHRKVATRLPVVLTVEQIEQLIAAAKNPLERAVIEVFYATGVRISELVKLRIEDIDWSARTIRVHKGKGGKDRIVLFGSKAEEAMRAYLEWRPSQAGLLFETLWTARPYNQQQIWSVVNCLGLRAGIPHVHPHALRRAFASHLLKTGGNLRAIQDLLGHKRIGTTMLYTKLDNSDIRRVYEKFHPYGGGTDEKS